MDVLLQDIRYAVRTLLKSPGFTLVAVLTLALGIGANTAIFSVVNAVLLRPLAYADPARLVALRGLIAVRGPNDVSSSAPEYRHYRDDVTAIGDAAAIWPININLTGDGSPERIQAAVVSYNYTSVLGVAPMLGRAFTKEDAGGRIGYVALISYDLWQRRFGGDRGVIGKVLRLDDDPIAIIGIMPRGFRHPMERGASPMELWAPIDLDNPDPNFINVRRARVFEVVGRLAPGATVDRTQTELDALTARMKREFPTAYPETEGWRASVIPLTDRVIGGVKPGMLVLLGAVGFVLLIACANVANLSLSRAADRGREIAIRAALGSTRARIVRQLLSESVLLALVGGALGVLTAVYGTEVLRRMSALYLPRAAQIGVDGTVLVFTFALSTLTGVAFGLLPALQASRPNVQGVLREGGPGASAGGRRTRLRASLVVTEIAVALVLIAGAGLLLRSFQRLVAVEAGFDPSQLLTLQMWLPVPNEPEKGRFFTVQQRRTFYSRMREALAGAPGVVDAALVSRLPFRGRNSVSFLIEGQPLAQDAPPPRSEVRLISPNYFAVMRIPLLRGTPLPLAEDSASATLIAVNQVFADKYWPGESPIGRRVRMGGPQAPWLTITAVVGAVRQISLETAPREEIYVSSQLIAGQEMAMVVRTAGPPENAQPGVLQAIHSVDAEQPVFAMMSMDQLLDDAGAPRRFSLFLLTLFAGIALLLSAIGIYGVMAYTTAQRRHEMGIRLALGAQPRDVLGLVVAQGMRLVAIGAAIGLVGAWGLSRLLTAQLYEISPGDPLTYLGAAGLLGAIALVANYLPARRAARLDPADALRSD